MSDPVRPRPDPIAALVERWREDADWPREEAQSPWDLGFNHALKRCAKELKAALRADADARSPQDVIEALAEYAHQSWSGWMGYLFSKCELCVDADTDAHDSLIPAEWADRWRRQMNTPYAQLSEAEKKSDRTEARAMLAIMSADVPRRAEPPQGEEYADSNRRDGANRSGRAVESESDARAAASDHAGDRASGRSDSERVAGRAEPLKETS